MTENRLEKRYGILKAETKDKRNNYTIHLDNSFISIRNIKTNEGIYTDSLKIAKRWIRKDMEEKW